MGLFGSLIKAAVNVATIPVAVTKDVFTLGNVLDGDPFTYTKAQEIKKNLNKAYKQLDNI